MPTLYFSINKLYYDVFIRIHYSTLPPSSSCLDQLTVICLPLAPAPMETVDTSLVSWLTLLPYKHLNITTCLHSNITMNQKTILFSTIFFGINTVCCNSIETLTNYISVLYKISAADMEIEKRTGSVKLCGNQLVGMLNLICSLNFDNGWYYSRPFNR